MTKKEYKQIKEALDRVAERMVDSFDKFNKDLQELRKVPIKPKKR